MQTFTSFFCKQFSFLSKLIFYSLQKLMNARMKVNLRSRRREVFGSMKKNGWCPLLSSAYYFQGPVPTFLALTTAHAGMATKAVEAFVMVNPADKCRDKI